MSIARFLVQPLELLRAPLVEDDYQDASRDWDQATTTEVLGWVAQVGTDEDNDHRSGVTTNAIASLPVGTDVVAHDRIRDADGRTWEVDGTPNIARTPRGPHHVEAALRAVEG